MGELVRTRSAAVIRSSSLDRSPTLLLSRTYSVPDVTSYIRSSDRYRPQWLNYYPRYYYTPYRYYRDYSISDDYWYDRSYYFSPLYYSSYSPRRYSYSDYITNPYLWSTYPSTYWTRYKSYWYDYDYPSYNRRFYDPSYNYYLRSYRPYRSVLLDNFTDSLLQGLQSYRQGVISFGQLKHNYISPTWDHYLKSYRDLYLWDSERNYVPTYYNSRARSYKASWVS
ncbi:hypothetical protein FO519_007602 [Halicephalobus sp. NKZ332]|nr:hypothetical protein FO519_007602 [Halicephalobus sp. NKZ332]